MFTIAEYSALSQICSEYYLPFFPNRSGSYRRYDKNLSAYFFQVDSVCILPLKLNIAMCRFRFRFGFIFC